MKSIDKIAYLLYCLPKKRRQWFISRLGIDTQDIVSNIERMSADGKAIDPSLVKQLSEGDHHFDQLLHQTIAQMDDINLDEPSTNDADKTEHGFNKDLGYWLVSQVKTLPSVTLALIFKSIDDKTYHQVIKHASIIKRRQIRHHLEHMGEVSDKKAAAIMAWLQKSYQLGIEHDKSPEIAQL